MAERPYMSLVFIDEPGSTGSKDRKTARQVRSHAVSVALARQRRRAQQQGENFREFASRGERHTFLAVQPRTATLPKTVVPSGYIGFASVDPFETLPINARRLTTLMHMKKCICAGEPVFNANEAINFQSLHSVFETGLTDGALTAALGLTMSYAANGRCLNHESVEYSSIALKQISKKLLDPDTACTPATIGTILLLLGTEYRLGARKQAQAHLDGIRALLRLCAKDNRSLPGPLRRAIYWQDLFSSIFVQTERIVSYKDFHPGKHAPKLSLSSVRYTPKGFACRVQRLGPTFIQIVSEVAALYRHRSEWIKADRSRQQLEKLCNTQADLEGRLHELRQSTSDELVISCTIATFLCAYAFWTDVWNAALIPRILSTQLLHHARCWQNTESQPDTQLFSWVVHIGKAFAIDANVRHGLDELHQSEPSIAADLPIGSKPAPRFLKEFIWSEIFYRVGLGWFWERIDDSL